MTSNARRTAFRTLALTLLLVWPLLPQMPYDAVNTAILAAEYCVVALSLVLLIGLVGQISLCQAALVGMGAFVSALATRHMGVHFPLTLVVGTVAGAFTAAVIGVVALRVRGLYLAVATLIFGYLCDQYLFTQNWLVQSQSGTSIPFETIGKPGTIPSFDLADAHIFYYVALAVAVIALYAVANLRDSRLGRAFASVRGSEVAAASLGIDVVRVKLLGFACAGALAGLGGALTLVGNRTVTPDQFTFMNSLYFLAIAVVGGLRSLGGAVASSVIFAVLVGEVFFRSPTLSDYLDLISSGLLIVVLLFFRGGLGSVADWAPERVRRAADRLGALIATLLPRRADANAVRRPSWVIGRRISARGMHLRGHAARLSRRVPWLVRGSAVEADSEAGAAMPQAGTTSTVDVIAIARSLSRQANGASGPTLHVERFDEDASPSALADDSTALATPTRDFRGFDHVAGKPAGSRRAPILLSAEHITVRFGGLTAVNDASLQVGAGEIVGLIGPNGAGKTTLFNSVLGLNTPTEGRVSIFERDVTTWDVHRRAALGVGRTFQILQLFGDLTVFDNLLVATHLQNRIGLWGSLAVTRRAREGEEAARERVRAVLDLMELEHVAHERVSGLPFGMLRIVEVARTLVTGARLVCFDEPASGLDSTETERLLDWFRFLRNIGVTLLVIEHDVSFVVRLCDYVYVLDQGRMLAHGVPAEVQRNPAVIGSYLGSAAEVA